MSENMSESVSRVLKARYHKEGKSLGLSLKEFARKLAKSGDAIAENWFANKAGLFNQEKSEAAKVRIALAKSAPKKSKESK